MEQEVLLQEITDKKLELSKAVEDFGLTDPKCVELNEEINQLFIQLQKPKLKEEADSLLEEIDEKNAELKKATLMQILTSGMVVEVSKQLDELVLRHQKITHIL